MAKIIELALRRQKRPESPSSASAAERVSTSGAAIVEGSMSCQARVARLWGDLDKMATLLSTIEDDNARDDMRRSINEARVGLVVATELLAQRTSDFRSLLTNFSEAELVPARNAARERSEIGPAPAANS